MGIIFWSTSKMRSAGAGVFFTFLVGGSQQLPQYSDYGEEYFPGFYSSPGIDPRVQYPLPAGFERPPAFVRDNFGRGRSDLEIDFRQVANEGDIIAQTRNLANNVKAFETLSEPAIVVREVANILRILGPLVNN